MSTGIARTLSNTNKVAAGLAVGTSAALGVAVATGSGLSAPETVGAFGAAGVITLLSVRSNRRPRVTPHVLMAVPEDHGALMVRADRARSLAAHPAAHSRSDAA